MVSKSVLRKGWLIAVLAALFPLAAGAQDANRRCAVHITSPTQGESFGETADVSGTAQQLPVGTRLWVIAHRQGMDLWWPQGSSPRKIEVDGEWHAVAFLGRDRDIGANFVIEARVFDQAGENKLEAWVAENIKTKAYDGMPPFEFVVACPVDTVTVRRTH